MEIDALALRVLTGVTLEDKLAAWPEVDIQAESLTAPNGIPLEVPQNPERGDFRRNRIRGTGAATPTEPGRPTSLALPRGRRGGSSIKGVSLESEAGRSRVLHELMNHELQAIELLALALLRWPDAPAGFRRGLVGILRDEQRHCRMYQARLEASGGEVGEQPVSRFFWDVLAPVQDPREFVAGLSLCFEQANLDFCQYWKGRFSQSGDAASAKVLQAVYEDEIRHVAHGLEWFTAWTEGDRLASWRQALPTPLTPSRARGPVFDPAGRRRAGFTEGEIDALRVVGGSRGRPGRAIWFDAGIEDVLATGTRSPIAVQITEDLATLPMFLVHAEDVVIAPEPPTPFLAALAEAGFEIPRFATSPEAVQPVPVSGCIAWGPCPDGRFEPTPWQDAWRGLSSKVRVAELAAALEHPAVVSERGAVWREPGDPGPGRWVLKAPYSTSGSRRIRGEGPLDERQRAWLDKALAAYGAVVCQPWYDRVFDVSVHLTVQPDGTRVDGITRFETGRGGEFRGTWLARWTHGLAADVARPVHGDGSPRHAMEGALQEAGRLAGEEARTRGFRGPLSIDGVVVRESDGLRIHPWLETNARLTLGRVGLALRAGVAPGSHAWFRVAPRTEGSLAKLASDPPVFANDRLASGCLPTSPPGVAERVLTWIEARQSR